MAAAHCVYVAISFVPGFLGYFENSESQNTDPNKNVPTQITKLGDHAGWGMVSLLLISDGQFMIYDDLF